MSTDAPRDRTVHSLFEEQARAAPDMIVAVHEGRTLTYGALDRSAGRLARRLRRCGVGPGVLVGISVARSLPMLVGILGVLKAGGAYVPMDPTYPKERLRWMLHETEAPVLVAQPDHARQLGFQGDVVPPDDDKANGDAYLPSGDPLQNLTSEAPAYVMFTSGSTGRPKGVVVPHRAIVRLVVQTNYIEFCRSDRVMHAASLSFDASTFEIWGALLNGARLVLVPQDTLLSPAALRAAKDRAGITVMFVTTSIFHHLASADPDVFSGLEYLVVGGETLDPKWARAVLRTGGVRRLINGYGPTENTTFSTTHLVRDEPDDTSSIAIGRPIAKSTAYVLDPDLSPVAAGVPGELYVGGDGLAIGYLRQPELTADRFIADPFSSKPGARLYRTGDFARYLQDGTIDFLGRRDRQVKIRGFRIELGEIEVALCACPLVKEASVVVREDVPGDKRIVAYVVAYASVDTKQIGAYLEARLPSHLLPSHTVLLPALPLSCNGKLDVSALPSPRDVRARAEFDEASPPSTSTETHLARIFNDILRMEGIHREDSFFDLGGDSILAARLIVRIRQDFRVDLPARYLFNAPSLARLAQNIDDARRCVCNDVASSTIASFHDDVELDPSIRPGTATRPSGPPRHIFLTGATGFLGAFLLRDLLRHTRAEICCLVRAEDTQAGMERIRAALTMYGLWQPQHEARILPIPGDLRQPLLGLDAPQFHALAGQVDTIYHSAAEVNYVKPYHALRGANVSGTCEVLRLACAIRQKPVHYLSSIGIVGHVGYFKGVSVVYETDNLAHGAPYLDTDMGYSQSKWVAEQLVSTARSRGLATSIFRPGFIMGDTTTGAANVDDFVCRLIKGCIHAGCYPDLPRQRKDFVPVDYVSAAVTRISLNPANLGRTYHLVPPVAESPDLQGFFELLRGAGHALRRLPFASWLECVVDSAGRSLSSPLLPLIPMLTEKVHEGLTRWELYEGMPVFDDTNTRQALAHTSLSCPPLDARLLRVNLAYLGGRTRHRGARRGSSVVKEPTSEVTFEPRAELRPKLRGSLRGPRRAPNRPSR
ncbi:amino acid adenylation domain-containing protein [Polyangium sp. 15x6]|uniref:amino acid adenylation domain-containing protein n=1 Tax=Polyangium sp. 15x6 TaxID=3042687 RepID=UPI00249CF13A|nr:amino acid adenylation domain-containing protein [Polyangium sp. 15x6]MDI3284632.1 amino acid adenylation domain-containing protein [Polyangium sp. 15x6]